MIQHVSETLSVPIAIDLNLLVKGDSSKQKKKTSHKKRIHT